MNTVRNNHLKHSNLFSRILSKRLRLLQYASLAILAISVIAFFEPRLRLNTKKIELARRNLSIAKGNEGSRYAPQKFADAEGSFNVLLFEWHFQNNRFFPLRDYRRIKALAQQVDTLSRLSSRIAKNTRDSLQSAAVIQRDELRNAVKKFKEEFGDLPMTAIHQENLTQSELVLSEAVDAQQRGDYLRACNLFAIGIDRIATTSLELKKVLSAYLDGFSQWSMWAEQTIAWSKKRHRPAIVIEKLAHVLAIYQNGKLASQMPIELGAHWIGDKVRQGDRATPEGRYFIRRKKTATRYHKALEIDYPNAEDRKLYKAAMKTISYSTGFVLGGNIEIHGKGGKLCNWTDGCAALSDADIDKLYSIVLVGTPVTIIGTAHKALADSLRK